MTDDWGAGAKRALGCEDAAAAAAAADAGDQVTYAQQLKHL